MSSHTQPLILISTPPSVSEFILKAKENHGYDEEQALAMLMWHHHDLDLASQDLPNFRPCPDQWTEEDKVLFEAAFKVQGKSFSRIQEMLPNKSIAALVQYHYLRKKTFMTSPCQFKANGCKVELQSRDKESHEEVCRSRPHLCPYLECHHKLPPGAVLDHLSDAHSERILRQCGPLDIEIISASSLMP